MVKNNDFDLDDLRAFSLIASAGGLSAAARRFDASKATLYRALERLETAAGTALFDRMGRGLRLTQTGKELRATADDAVRIAQEADQTLRGAQGEPHGTLRIAANAVICQWLVAPVIAMMAREYPDVRVELIVESQHVDPVIEDLDVVLRVGLPEEPYLIARRVLTGHMRLYAHRLRAKNIDPSDFVALEQLGRVVVDVPGIPQIWNLEAQDGRVVTMSSEPLVTVGETRVATDILLAGVGLGYILDSYVSTFLNATDIVPVMSDFRGDQIDLYATLPPRRTSVPAVREFLDKLIDYADAASAGGEI